ncbi:MAG TPA: histidine kinase [Burkholderiaceae bacterium]|nr:histidine kinase [Burkholderiaceae bacterium]
MTPAAPAVTPPAADHWERARLVPSRRQLASAVVLAVGGAIALNPITLNPFIEVLGETLFVGMVLLLAFKVAGAWPQALLPVWVAQLVAVVIGAAVSPFIVQMLTVGGDFSAFVAQKPLVRGYVLVTLSAALIGSMFALGALYRERDAQARAEALRFALERETLQRQAADARLHLLTAQIEPHFLLNTLANVQQLVESGSPRAVPLFRSLIAYLRAALPQLQQPDATVADEERLVRAYLELMLMRMPDRLAFSIEIEPAVRTLAFPPMALLTLVENAIRHGIDPALDGGRIEVGARRDGAATLRLWVADTGAGLGDGAGSAGGGAGLRNLRERLLAFYGPAATLELIEQQPSGVRADLRVPLAAGGTH